MGVRKLGSSLTLEWSPFPELACRDIVKNVPEALWGPSPMPDARTATELEAKAIPNALMGIEVLPLECRQFPADAVPHKIKTQEQQVPERRWQKKRTEREPFYEKERVSFRDNLKPPDPDVIKAIRDAGFSNISEDAVDFESVSPSVWLKTPTFVQMGKLPPAPHGG